MKAVYTNISKLEHNLQSGFMPVHMCHFTLMNNVWVDETPTPKQRELHLYSTVLCCYSSHYKTTSLILQTTQVNTGLMKLQWAVSHLIYLCTSGFAFSGQFLNSFLKKKSGTKMSLNCIGDLKNTVLLGQTFLAVCGVSAGMEIYLLISSLSSHLVAAKVHRSLYIKFFQLTWHTAVNQSMKGKLICCSPPGVSSSSFHHFNVFFANRPKNAWTASFPLAASRSRRVKPLSLHFAFFNGFVFGLITGGFPLWWKLSSRLCV